MKVYGLNPVMEALRSQPERIDRLLIAKGKSGHRLQEVIDAARKAGLSVRFEPREHLARLAGTPKHQDVVAVLAEARLSDLAEILEANPRFLLVVDNLEDPHNLGALLRTAEATGVQGVLLPERRCCGITPTVVKSSAGAALHLKIARIGNVSQTLERLKKEGFWIAALDAAGESRLENLDCSLPLAIVIGGENIGLRPLVRRHCDFVIALPMWGKVNSLNLSVAAGIVLHHVGLARSEQGKQTRRQER